MASPQEIVLQYVCPGLGCAVALLLFSSPLPAVRRVVRSKQLGDLNVLPFAMMVANCISWVLYGFLLTDWFIYVGNIPGVMLGLYYVLNCYKYSKESAQDAIVYLLLAVVLLFCTIGIIDMAAINTLPAAKTLW
jgi:solute carrier family 50 protein (sugar transporter)